MTANKPAIGSVAKDTRKNAVGRVMGHEGPYVQLRPVGGGKEWDAAPDDLRVATHVEAARAGADAASAGGERP